MFNKLKLIQSKGIKKQGSNRMNESKISRLEDQVCTITKLIEHLKAENDFLRKKMSTLVQERAELLEKKNKAVSSLKKIVKQLKAYSLETAES